MLIPELVNSRLKKDIFIIDSKLVISRDGLVGIGVSQPDNLLDIKFLSLIFNAIEYCFIPSV